LPEPDGSVGPDSVGDDTPGEEEPTTPGGVPPGGTQLIPDDPGAQVGSCPPLGLGLTPLSGPSDVVELGPEPCPGAVLLAPLPVEGVLTPWPPGPLGVD
jgi:hypothetical protein